MTIVGNRLQALTVGPDATLRETMVAIDRGAAEIALVADEDGHLVGTVTDGDVRRALLAGEDLASPVGPHISEEPITVSHTADRAHVLDLMQAHLIAQVPMVDVDGRIVGLHLLRSLLGAEPRPNWAVIMAGGLGTRLRPVTEEIPKPMVPVAGRPLLERIVLHLVGNGIREIVISVNYLGHVIEGHFGDGSSLGCRIRYVRESPDHPLGTAGSLAMVRELDGGPNKPVLVMNGDVILQLAVGEMIDCHHDSGSLITVGATQHAYRVPFGVLELEGGQVHGLLEKPMETWAVNAGVYVLDPDVLELVPTGEYVDMTTLVGNAIEQGEQVGVWHLENDWIDVGRPGDLNKARGIQPGSRHASPPG